MVLTGEDIGSFARDTEWLASNFEEIRDSGSKIVAIKDEKVLVEGETMEDILMKLEKFEVDLAFLLIETIPSEDMVLIL